MNHNPFLVPRLSSFKSHRQRVEPVDAQQLARKLVHHLSRGRLLCFRLRFLVFFSLPSLYFLVSYPWRFLALNLVGLLALLRTLLVSLNFALPRLPSIRLLLARSLPASQLGSSPISSKAVLVDWVKAEIREEGEFRNLGTGLKNGTRVYRFYTGEVYAREWSNGQCHGCGVHSYEDGSEHVGEFRWGLKHGVGQYNFRNGDVYCGEYFSVKIHGFGVYQFGNGHRYKGAWHEGRRQGFGTYTFRMVRHNPITRKMVLWMFLAEKQKTLGPESFMLFRKQDELLRKLETLQRSMRE
ncbi:hypothetical protein F3Y22_tig00013960pilonHSYRG00212 [Hibiscus syriacus]|uniref:Uncharacterized protein n=1 Tax=Hibiscus syriacus TaxID=106335 RepID=A0A6A3C0P0_HIBSY|nr:hypothetical protein F3Y22_tig00013960pilonHSYRG00212 [Hibiscus syriacus]